MSNEKVVLSMNKTPTDFEALRVPQLEKIYNGINHSVEELQGKMNRDMGRSLSKYDIHPRNYNIIPEIEKCSLHDLELLEELTEKSNNIEESQKQVKLEKTDSYIELYNLRKKKETIMK